ncbi:MAG: nickel-responsive transcriptional regulator NikR [Spirochaetales bacterium]|nr:nickel-responsive transcriptional regulator NikR [Spirochaetales bacterium]
MARDKSDLERFSVTIDRELLAAFDRSIAEKGYATRSAAVSDLVREALIEREVANPDAPAAGAVVMVYDHRRRRLAGELTGRQHRTHHDVIASLHVHLDEGTCLEIIALRGTAGRIRRVADELLSLKGVKHGRFIETAVGKYV